MRFQEVSNSSFRRPDLVSKKRVLESRCGVFGGLKSDSGWCFQGVQKCQSWWFCRWEIDDSAVQKRRKETSEKWYIESARASLLQLAAVFQGSKLAILKVASLLGFASAGSVGAVSVPGIWAVGWKWEGSVWEGSAGVRIRRIRWVAKMGLIFRFANMRFQKYQILDVAKMGRKNGSQNGSQNDHRRYPLFPKFRFSAHRFSTRVFSIRWFSVVLNSQNLTSEKSKICSPKSLKFAKSHVSNSSISMFQIQQFP